MEDVYMLADTSIAERIGANLRTVRLRQNITQQSLANTAGVSLSSLKKIEKGSIASFDSFLRILRALGKLNVLQPLIAEEQLSPNEYYEFVNSAHKKVRQRAAGRLNPNKAEPEW